MTPGQVYTVEGGIGYGISKIVTLGAVGYYQMQTTSSTGPTANSNRNRVAAIGPEIATFFASAMFGVSLRYEYEFMAEGGAPQGRLQGNTIMLTLTKKL